MKHKAKSRFGTISIAGRPNAGKSTLLNALLGTKLAIVSGKPQTTRHNIMGVWMGKTAEGAPAQAVIFDTPGIHASDTLLNRRMMQSVRAALESRDLLLYMADAHALGEDGQLPPAESEALDTLRRARQNAATPAFLVMNKIDLLENRALLLPRLEAFRQAMDFTEFFPISAKTGEGVKALEAAMVAALPEGDAVYEEDYLTDLPERAIVAEVIRERILENTNQEVPHSVAVLIDKWEETPKVAKVFASLIVERDGQKPILIGAGGQMLKKIGTEARLALEDILGKRFHLQLFVKVRPKWREDEQFLDELKWQNTSEVKEIK
ncbi:MAG: GTPase Era [Bryobacter sp.]|nr:GTPase Era [Bryobacter sp.]